MTPAITTDSLPRAAGAAARDQRAEVEVFYLVNREALSSVFTAQVLTPISQHTEHVRMRLGVLMPLGHHMRSDLRERMGCVRTQAAETYGIDMTCLIAPPTRWPWLWSNAGRLRRWISRERQGDGPVVLHCRNAAMTEIALDAARLLPDARVIFDSRGAEVVEFAHGQGLDPSQRSAWPARHQKTFSKLEARQQRVVGEADHVLCVSNAMRQYLAQTCDLDPERSTVVPCCPDVARFQVSEDTRTEMRRKLKLEDKLVVAYCGSMEWYQLPDQSLRMFRLVHAGNPMSRFLAITTQPAQMRKALLESGVSEELATVVSVPPSDVPRYLSAADVGLLLRDPTIVNRVASPVKFGEYMAAGLPTVITPGIGDFSEEGERRRLGCVVKLTDDDQSLSTQLARFLSSPEFSNRQVHERCAAFAVEHLEWKSHLPRIAAVYQQLVSEAPSAIVRLGDAG